MDYKGHDYTELFPVLGIVEPQIDGWGQEEEIEAFENALMDLFVDAGNNYRTISHVRAYVRAMAEADVGYWKPIWNGIADCEDDFTFLQVCHALAGHMWT